MMSNDGAVALKEGSNFKYCFFGETKVSSSVRWTAVRWTGGTLQSGVRQSLTAA